MTSRLPTRTLHRVTLLTCHRVDVSHDELAIAHMNIFIRYFIILGLCLLPSLKATTFGEAASAAGYNDTTSLFLLTGRGITSLDGMSDYTNAITVNVTFNELSTLSENQFMNMVNLTQFYAPLNDLTELAANNFAMAPNLQEIWLGANAINAIDADAFNGLNVLQAIQLQSNQLTQLDSQPFQGMASLRSLWLHDNALTTLPMNTFAGLVQLESLQLQSNQLASIDDWFLDDLGQLETLLLKANDISEIADATLKPLVNLETLDLAQNRLSGISTQTLAGLRQLDWIDLSQNDLASMGFHPFSWQRDLVYLDLSMNELTSVNLNYGDYRKLKLFRIGGQGQGTKAITSVGLRAALVDDQSFRRLFDDEVPDYQGAENQSLQFYTGSVERIDFTHTDLSDIDLTPLEDFWMVRTMDLAYTNLTNSEIVSLVGGMLTLRSQDGRIRIEPTRVSSLKIALQNAGYLSDVVADTELVSRDYLLQYDSEMELVQSHSPAVAGFYRMQESSDLIHWQTVGEAYYEPGIEETRQAELPAESVIFTRLLED